MAITVVNNPGVSRYDLLADGERIGSTFYDLRGDVITFTHTEVDETRRESGMGSQLVQEALDDVRANSTRRVVASCPYVRHWLSRHPKYRDLQLR